MKAWVSLIVVLVAVAGCASATLPYQPAQQPEGARISAAYQLTGDRLRVEIDTDGRRLEEARILRVDGTEVRAETIDNPPVVQRAPRRGSGSASVVAASAAAEGLGPG